MRNLTPFEWAVQPLKRYATFSGRAARAEYWWFYLATVIAGMIAGVIDGLVGNDEVAWLGGALNLLLIVPTIAATVRRLHDTDRSGWWLVGGLAVLIGLVAIATAASMGGSTGFGPAMIAAIFGAVTLFVILFIFMVLPGTDGPNSYGPDPYGPDHLEEIFA